MKKILMIISILSLLFGTSIGNKDTVPKQTCQNDTYSICVEAENQSTEVPTVPECDVCEDVPQTNEVETENKTEETAQLECDKNNNECNIPCEENPEICDNENDCDTVCQPENNCENESGKCNNGFVINGQNIFERINEILNSKSTVSEPVLQSPEAQETSITDEQKEVFDLVNKARTENGLKPLKYREDIQNSADIRAEEIVSLFSHTRPDGSNCFTVLKQNGISYMAAGENIAYGQRTATEVMNGWMNSSGHRANILSGNFTGVAIGLAQKGNVKYWVQIFVG